MTYSIGIVAHESRINDAIKLYNNVNAKIISIDSDTNNYGERLNHQIVLEKLIKFNTDWYILLEDDAIPCKNFNNHLYEYLSKIDSIASLYLGTGRWAGTNPRIHSLYINRIINNAKNNNAKWIRTESLYHAVAICVPNNYSKSVLEFIKSSNFPTDEAISKWCKSRSKPVYYSNPSLIDHADKDRIVRTRDTSVPRHAIIFNKYY